MAVSAEKHCSVEGCEQPFFAKTFCQLHYDRFRRTGRVDLKAKVVRLCAVDGCNKKHLAKGYCKLHYQRLNTHGDARARVQRHEKQPKRCTVEQCPNAPIARGLCNKHYRRWKTTGEVGPAGAIEKPHRLCSEPACGRPHKAKGLCEAHYRRRTGITRAEAPLRAKAAAINRIQHLIENPTDECVFWPKPQSYRSPASMSVSIVAGSRALRPRQTKIKASRAMCILAHGDPPNADYQAAHSCGNGHLDCYNPRHLRWATPRENMADKLLQGVRVYVADDGRANKAQIAAIQTLGLTMVPAQIAAAFRISIETVEAILGAAEDLKAA